MAETDLTKLRRARLRVHRVLAKLEPIVAGYQAKLADLEVRIHKLDPQLRLSPRFHRRSPVFARGELTRLAFAVLREVGEPISTPRLAVRVLALKGHDLPPPRLRRIVQHRLRERLAETERRGVVVWGLPAGGEWRCMSIPDITHLTTNPGVWHTGDRHTRPQTCVKVVDIEVPH